MATEIAVLGGGCFWCTEAVFVKLRGVRSAVPGYTGGKTRNPSYESVSAGGTGHAEVIHIEFDPALISYADVLSVFFATHDPTTMNRQGNDVGEQYRSIIFYTSEEQKREAEELIAKLNSASPKGARIVTAVEPLQHFYEAEDYHRNYFARNRNAPYCQLVINPKLEMVERRFAQLLDTSS